MNKQPRPYQIECEAAIVRAGPGRHVVAKATGTGKSVVARRLPRALNAWRSLVVAHTTELIEQLERHMREENDDARVSVEKADRWVYVPRQSQFESKWREIVVASKDTLFAVGARRLRKFPRDWFNLIIVDEAHHCNSKAESYLSILKHFGALDENGKKVFPCPITVIGLTATPLRGDTAARRGGRNMADVWDGIIFSYDYETAKNDGYLVPPITSEELTPISLDEVDIRQGEYVQDQLAAKIDVPERNAAAFDACDRRAKELRTLIFCANIQHSQDMAEFFRKQGRDAIAVWGTMPSDDRVSALRHFSETPGSVLTNFKVLGEGVDISGIPGQPNGIECVVNAAPTMSETVLAQRIGRGARLPLGAENLDHAIRLGLKRELVLIDLTDSTSRLGKQAVRIGDIFGLSKNTPRLHGEDPFAVREAQQLALLKRAEKDLVKTVSKSIDLFAPPPAGAIPAAAKFPWVYLSENELRLMLPDHEQVRVVTNAIDLWCIESLINGVWTPALSPRPDKAEAVRLAETLVEELKPDALRLLAWRQSSSKKRPSEKQIDYARDLGIEIPDGVTAVELSNAIDRKKAAGGDKPSRKFVNYARYGLRIRNAHTMSKPELIEAVSEAKRAQEVAVLEYVEQGVPF